MQPVRFKNSVVAKRIYSLIMIVAMSLSLFEGFSPVRASALGDGLAETPPMGWNSWNRYGCNINESLIRNMADSIVSSGMKDAGYEYVNVDDCWQTGRDGQGNIVVDPVRFPSGMKALADYVHSKGLKFGIYTDAGRKTCAGRPGSYQYEAQDAKTYAAWGVDLVKVDWCHSDGLDPKVQYAKFKDAFQTSGRSMVLSICNWGVDHPWIWGPNTGQLWRTTEDIMDSWKSVSGIIDQNGPLAGAAGPGTWNDPDMLMVGNYGTGAIGGGGMTDTEYRSHFSMWAIMAAPLIAGNDLGNMNNATKDILMNKEVIAVDQDPLGKQGRLIRDENGLQVWSKPLAEPGTRAIVLFNRTGASAEITVDFAQVGLSGSIGVRDLWEKADKGNFSSSYTANVEAHGVIMLKATGTEGGSASSISGKTFRLIAKHSGKSLAVQYASLENGAPVTQFDYGTAGNDQWTFYETSGGYYKIINALSGKTLAVKNASIEDGAPVIQWDYGTEGNDQWQIVPVSDGYYSFINRHSGKALNVTGGLPDNGTPLIQWPYRAENNMAFQLVSLNRVVELETANFTGKFIRHQNGRGMINGSQYIADAQWRVVRGLASDKAISLESVNFPGHFLRHKNGEVWMDVNDGTALFKKDASWKLHSGFSNRDAVSLEAYGIPSQFMRHKDGKLWITTIQSDLDKQDATFWMR